MTRPTSRPSGRLLATVLLPLLVALPATSAFAQAKKVLSVEDYSKWRTISAAQISGDGKWVVYGLSITNVVTPDAKPEVHLKRLDTGEEVVIKDASQPQFSADSRWVVYQVEPPPRAPARGAAGAPGAPGTPADSAADTTAAGRARTATPDPKRVELRELATGKVQKWEDVATATFSPTATHLLLRRRPASGAGASGGGGGGPQGPPGGQGGQGAGAGGGNVRGTDALLHNLATGRSQFLGSVGEADFI